MSERIPRSSKCLGALGAFAIIPLQLHPSVECLMNPNEMQKSVKNVQKIQNIQIIVH